jgi:hypothetical protein
MLNPGAPGQVLTKNDSSSYLGVLCVSRVLPGGSIIFYHAVEKNCPRGRLIGAVRVRGRSWLGWEPGLEQLRPGTSLGEAAREFVSAVY